MSRFRSIAPVVVLILVITGCSPATMAILLERYITKGILVGSLKG